MGVSVMVLKSHFNTVIGLSAEPRVAATLARMIFLWRCSGDCIMHTTTSAVWDLVMSSAMFWSPNSSDSIVSRVPWLAVQIGTSIRTATWRSSR